MSSFCTNFPRPKNYKPILQAEKSCTKNFLTKKAVHIKCWWNWNLLWFTAVRIRQDVRFTSRQTGVTVISVSDTAIWTSWNIRVIIIETFILRFDSDTDQTKEKNPLNVITRKLNAINKKLNVINKKLNVITKEFNVITKELNVIT